MAIKNDKIKYARYGSEIIISGGPASECICAYYVISRESVALDKYVFYRKDFTNFKNSDIRSLNEIESISPLLFELLIKNIDIIKFENDPSCAPRIFIYARDFSSYILPQLEIGTFKSC